MGSLVYLQVNILVCFLSLHWKNVLQVLCISAHEQIQTLLQFPALNNMHHMHHFSCNTCTTFWNFPVSWTSYINDQLSKVNMWYTPVLYYCIKDPCCVALNVQLALNSSCLPLEWSISKWTNPLEKECCFAWQETVMPAELRQICQYQIWRKAIGAHVQRMNQSSVYINQWNFYNIGYYKKIC